MVPPFHNTLKIEEFFGVMVKNNQLSALSLQRRFVGSVLVISG
jgi:hypothetical protein